MNVWLPSQIFFLINFCVFCVCVSCVRFALRLRVMFRVSTINSHWENFAWPAKIEIDKICLGRRLSRLRIDYDRVARVCVCVCARAQIFTIAHDELTHSFAVSVALPRSYFFVDVNIGSSQWDRFFGNDPIALTILSYACSCSLFIYCNSFERRAFYFRLATRAAIIVSWCPLVYKFFE